MAMIKTRNNIFETNSSSSHSISISDTDMIYFLDTSLIPDNMGFITLNGGEFGWRWERFNDALTKANYCAVDQFENKHNLQMLKEVIQDQTGCIDVIFNINLHDYDNLYCSYIDHQSEGISDECFESKQALRNFIFNKKSYLFTGSDNESHPPNFYDIEDKHYTWQIQIEGNNLVEKFTEKPDKKTIEDAIIRLIERHPSCSDSYNYSPNKGYEFCYYDFKADDGKICNSLSKLRYNKIQLFKIEYKYTSKGTKRIVKDIITLKLIMSEIDETVII